MCHRLSGLLAGRSWALGRLAARVVVLRLASAGLRLRLTAAGFARIQERGFKLLAGRIGLADKKAKHTTEGMGG